MDIIHNFDEFIFVTANELAERREETILKINQEKLEHYNNLIKNTRTKIASELNSILINSVIQTCNDQYKDKQFCSIVCYYDDIIFSKIEKEDINFIESISDKGKFVSEVITPIIIKLSNSGYDILLYEDYTGFSVTWNLNPKKV
jgi:hypothetical protein